MMVMVAVMLTVALVVMMGTEVMLGSDGGDDSGSGSNCDGSDHE